MRQDRFLMAILGSILLLVVVALVVFFTRQERVSFGPEDTPEGVVINYILAIEAEDYRRAFSYLKDGPDRPDFDQFQKTFLSGQLDTRNSAVEIGDVRLNDRDAVIDLMIVQKAYGLFGDVYRNPGKAFLEQDVSGAWKISQMPYPYWNWDWYTAQMKKTLP